MTKRRRIVHLIKYVDELGREVWSEAPEKASKQGSNIVHDHMRYKIIGSTIIEGVQYIKVRKF